MSRVVAAVLLAVSAVASAAGVLAGDAPSTAAPGGWRWEAYRDVQLAVPPSWGYGEDWVFFGSCGSGILPPLVARPSLVGCGTGGTPGSDAAEDGQFVVFEDRRGYDGEFDGAPVYVGDRRALEIGDIRVIVQAPLEVRRRILASVRRIEVDAYGCAVRDRISREPWSRPAPATDLASLTGITGVTACLYPLGRGDPMLAGSVRLGGEAGRRAVRAMAAAPEAGPLWSGQDVAGCRTWGYHVAVLYVDSDQGRARLHLRFSGCHYTGLDDGLTRRQLVRAGTYPFVTGPNEVDTLVGGRDTSVLRRPGPGHWRWTPPLEEP